MKIEHVPVNRLMARMGFREPFEVPASFATTQLHSWTMVTEDAAIIRYLMSNLNPSRHLEFGTLTGQGTMTVLTACNATVWTINLPEGEKTDSAGPAYYRSRREPVTLLQRLGVRPGGRTIHEPIDTVGSIGAEFRDAGLGHRVCQVYCNSLDWDTSNYPEGFFDSVLVDGGHQQDIVINDTHKGLGLLRSGGLILWHDYVPLPDVQKRCPSVPEVVQAIDVQFDLLREQLADLFWIDPSWLLVGIKD